MRPWVRAESREQRAESREQRAEGRGQRAEGRGQSREQSYLESLSSRLMPMWMAMAGKVCSMSSWARATHRWTDFTKITTWMRGSLVRGLPSAFLLPRSQTPAGDQVVSQKIRRLAMYRVLF